VIRRRTTAVIPRPRLAPLTDAPTGVEHRVTDEGFAKGRRANRGRYLAVCGAVVVVAAMASPNGKPCASCVTWALAA
jgi:hypothetical protein